MSAVSTQIYIAIINIRNIQFDCFIIGVRFGKTLGSPITLVVKNRDFEAWKKIMSIAPEDVTDEKAFQHSVPDMLIMQAV